jgi:serine/threonine-protein kinase
MDLETEAAQRVGTTICNKWTLERLIGTGGMAAVYVANHKIGRTEAIKILHSDVARDPELRARFEQEANAVNRFKHPGVVEIRDVDVAEDGAPFLVMELLDGQPLSALARRPEGVPLVDLLRLVEELLDVLAAAHAQGIIHRDVKPDNLFVLRDGRLKVLDFGIARVRAGAALPGAPAATGPSLRTRVGATLGTAPYMPPEQIRGLEIDGRADLFAVGATMFRLIARRRIHEAANEPETLVKMASLPAPPLASVAPAAPRDVCLVVDRALMFDRAQRYPDALTMQSDVRAVRAGQPPAYALGRLTGDAAGPPPPGLIDAAPATQAATPVVVDAPTAAASPGALHLPPPPVRAPIASDAVTLHVSAPAAMTPPPASLRLPVLGPPLDDPATRAAGHAGGDAPATAPGPATPDAPATTQPAPTPSPETAPAAGLAERTLRSQMGPEGPGQVVPAQGYVVATSVIQAPPSAAAGPRTQLSGIAPPPAPPAPPAQPAPLAPGESVPVVAAPPKPKRRYTLPGTEIGVWPLVGVGVLFAALGVGLTLYFMLRQNPDDMTTYQIPTAAPTITSHVPTHVPPPSIKGPPPRHR